jgi:hypothetical protein
MYKKDILGARIKYGIRGNRWSDQVFYPRGEVTYQPIAPITEKFQAVHVRKMDIARSLVILVIVWQYKLNIGC